MPSEPTVGSIFAGHRIDLEKMVAHLKDPVPSLWEARPELSVALDVAVQRALA